MKKAKSTVFLVLTATIWGFAFVAQRVGADYLRPFTFNGIRFVMGALSLIPVILIFERKNSKWIATWTGELE
jgi:drug/metabolite transporter (DMT)-like permease